MMRRNVRSWCCLVLAMSACVYDSKLGGLADEGSDGGEDSDGADASSGTSGSASTAGSEGGIDSTATATGPEPVPTVRGVDILLVVDNSGSMAEEQAALVVGISALVQVLDDNVIDWRIGVTTTDNGNPWCNGTTSEGGALRLSSCRGRLEEFVFNGAMTVDAADDACRDICPHETIEVLPTTTSVDGVPKPRPWIESIGGQLNLPDGIEVDDALGCVVPQGINGCGFEQHLESAYKAVNRTENVDESSFGFIREGALLAILFVSDEADCSHNGDWSTIFLPTENDGNEIFWSDPENQSSPTSAVCWNAGVVCSALDNGTYSECHAQDKNVDGIAVSADVAEGQAVLHPLARYVGRFQEYPTYLAAIDGVPEGYPEGTAQMSYRVSDDPQTQLDFGIAPACETTAGRAIPSVRVRELVEQLEGERNNFSICASDLAPALTTIAQRIVARLP